MKLNVFAIVGVLFAQANASTPINPVTQAKALLGIAKGNLKILEDNVKIVRESAASLDKETVGNTFLTTSAALFLDLFSIVSLFDREFVGPRKSALEADALPVWALFRPTLVGGCCGRRGVATCPIQPASTCSFFGCRPDCSFAILEAVRCSLQAIEANLDEINIAQLNPQTIITIVSIITGTLEAYFLYGAFIEPCFGDGRIKAVAPIPFTNLFSNTALAQAIALGLPEESPLIQLVESLSDYACDQNPGVCAWFDRAWIPEDPEIPSKLTE